MNELILTRDGLKEISKIEVGNEITSYDEATDSFTTSVVSSVIVHDGRQYFMNNFSSYPLLRLTVNINDKLYETKVTDNHPYFDAVARSYRKLRDFKIGDKVKTVDGEGIIVHKEVLINGDSPAHMQNEIVYNLHMIQGPSNYIVNGAVVHNK